MMQPLATYEDLAGLLDHSLLQPDLIDAQVVEGCALALRMGVASVTVRPCDIDIAVRSGARIGSVAGFPHGTENTGTKLYEGRDLLRRGAKEIDMVLNVSKLLARQFQHVETEILQMSESCHKEGAILKVILENVYLTDELRIIACRICSRVEAHFVSTATGFGPLGFQAADAKVLRAHLPEDIGVKAAGGIETLEAALEAYEAGCTRIGTSHTAHILDEWKLRLAAISEAARQQTVRA